MAVQLGPLGLLPSFKTKKSVNDKLLAIETLDLGSEKSAFARRHAEHVELVDVAERELKRFLALHVLFTEPDYALAPARLVDELWHEFILNTPKYMRFCEEVFGVLPRFHGRLS